MKIANVIEEARLGGPQKRIVEVGAKLLESGIETIIVTRPDNQEDLVTIATGAGLSVETVKVVRLRQNLSVMIRYVLKFLPDVFGYYKLFKQHRPDVVHTNGASQWKPAIAARLAKIPVVWHLNDTRCPVYVSVFFKLFSRFCASAFIVSSNRTRDVYLGNNRKKPIILARPPVNHARFSSARKTMDGDPYVVLTVGNLNPDKDILTYIRMAQLAHEVFGDAMVFRVVGRKLDTQADYNARIQALLDERPHCVQFLGFVDNVPQLLAESDVFVCTSRSEAGPMSVFEAFAAGVPVVTTDVGDIRDITREHGPIALVADVGDEKELFNQLKRLLDPEFNIQTGKSGQDFSAKHLDLSKCAKGHEEAYGFICNPKR